MAASLLALVVWTLAASFTATSALAFPHFLLAVAGLGLVPGLLVLEATRVRVDALERVTLAVAFGLVSSAIAYGLGLRLGIPWLVFLLPCLGAARLLRRRRPPAWPTPAGLHHLALLAVIAAALLPLVPIPLYARNLALLGDGRLSFYPFADAVLHLSMAQELTHRSPPETPFMPGTPANYHMAMDLLAAMLARSAGIAVEDLVVRFVPALLLTLAVVVGYLLGRDWLGSPWWSVVVAWLFVQGEDFSFLPGLLIGSDPPWIVHFFGMPNVVSLYLLNPMLPGLVALLLALLGLGRACREDGLGWPVLVALAAVALAESKVFCAVQLLTALGLGAVVAGVRGGERGVIRVAAVSGLAIAPLLLATWLGSAGRAVVQLQPWPYVPAALIRTGLFDTWLGEATAAFWRGAISVTSLVGTLGVAVPLYLAMTFGLRTLGAGRLVAALGPQANAARRVTALFVLLGPPLTLLLAITPAGYAPRSQYNDAVWFMVQSKAVAWLFLGEALAAFGSRLTRRGRIASGAAALALALPGTVQYVAYQAARSDVPALRREEVEVLAFLDRAPAGTAVLARPETAQAIIATTRCRSPVLSVWPNYFLGRAGDEYHADRLDRFWRVWNEGRVAADVAYGARYVVVEKGRDRSLAPDPAPCPLPPRVVLENAAFVVYEIGC